MIRKILKAMHIPFNLLALGIFLATTLNNAIYNGYDSSLVWKYVFAFLLVNITCGIAYVKEVK